MNNIENDFFIPIQSQIKKHYKKIIPIRIQEKRQKFDFGNGLSPDKMGEVVTGISIQDLLGDVYQKENLEIIGCYFDENNLYDGKTFWCGVLNE